MIGVDSGLWLSKDPSQGEKLQQKKIDEVHCALYIACGSMCPDFEQTAYILHSVLKDQITLRECLVLE